MKAEGISPSAYVEMYRRTGINLLDDAGTSAVIQRMGDTDTYSSTLPAEVEGGAGKPVETWTEAEVMVWVEGESGLTAKAQGKIKAAFVESEVVSGEDLQDLRESGIL